MTTFSLSLISLAYQLGPAVRTHGTRAPACTMGEYRLNNYILPGPVKPLGNQVQKCSHRTKLETPCAAMAFFAHAASVPVRTGAHQAA